MKPFKIALFLLLVGGGCSLTAQESRKKRGGHKPATVQTDSVAKPRLSEYEKLTNGANVSKGFVNVVKKGRSIYLEIPDSILGRDLLLGCRVAGISNNRKISAGQMRNNPKLLHFKKEGRNLLLIIPTSRNTVDSTDGIAPSVALNNMVPITRIFDIAATSKTGNYLVDVTKYFTEEVAEVWPPDLTKQGKLESKVGGIKSAKAFAQNVEIVTDYYYTGAREPFSVSMNYSLLLLSKEPMRERYSDDRAGFMNDAKRIYSIDGPVQSRKFISRFRIEPKPEEVVLHQSGALVEPATPIIFYVDTVMPEIYRQYARQGIEMWNKAFEQIGFKNVIRAYDFPNSPDFSSNDITKNCLHYIATEQENASGPCWTDPRSGEIIQADILWYHSVTNLLQRWRFLQTAAADPAARKKVLDEEVMGELIRYAVAHEMGHCLGLQHNMRGSYAYPVDSLRSPSFTQKYGTTSTIMDYARNNHVAQPGDAERGVRMTPPELGPFDYLSIAFGYTPVYGATTSAEEVPYLSKLFTDKGNDPMYLFAPMTVGAIVPDPSAQSDALSNDLIRSGEMAISNLRYILSHLIDWHVEEGDNYSTLGELVEGVHKQYMRHLSLAASYIGGVYTYQGVSGHHRAKYVPVDKATQRAAVQFIFKQLRQTATWANPTELATLLGDKSESLIKRQSDLVVNLVSSNLLSRIAHGTDNASTSGYTVSNYLDDVTNEVFAGSGTSKLTNYQIALQLTYIQSLASIASSATKNEKGESRPTSELLSASAAMHALQKASSKIKNLSAQGGANQGHYLLLLKCINH
ncbi:MAG: zinc-dependent metalloprotease [Phocaeicola sp.]